VVVLILFIITAHWAWTYSGPYRLVANLLLETVGVYAVSVVLLLAFASLALPASLVSAMLHPKTTPASARPGLDKASRAESVEPEQGGWRGHFGRTPFVLGLVYALTAASSFVAHSLGDFLHLKGNTTEAWAIGDLENLTPFDTRRCEVRATPMIHNAVELRARLGAKVNTYFPLAAIGPGATTNVSRLVVLSMPSDQVYQILRGWEKSGHFQGIAASRNIPGPVRDAMRRQGLAVPYFPVELRIDNFPARTRSRAHWLFPVGLLISLIPALLGAYYQWWWRPSAKHNPGSRDMP
jgi:hypothetical protein